MRRALLVLTALPVAFLAALTVLGTALLAAALSAPASTGLAAMAMAAWLGEGGAALALRQGVVALWLGAVLLGLGPVTIVALLGEAAGHRGWLWYGAATGVLTAVLPALLRAGFDRPAMQDGAVAIPLFLAGVVSGWVYWLIAGRGAGPR